MKHTSYIIAFLMGLNSLHSQNNFEYWQQHVDYTMDVKMDVNTFNYEGTQKLIYTNNSPDNLEQVFYHLFYNAFQPGSEMDVRSITIADADTRVGDRISKLQKEDFGFLNVVSLTQNKIPLKYTTSGTMLEVQLNEPIKSGESAIFEMRFEGQVPPVIRRAGKNSQEGVALSMAQWYPKMAEYDFEGWHADPYIGREFHGVWGDFDVKLTLDKNYTVGGTGYLQNPNEIGHGYGTKETKNDSDLLTWHFVAPNVHDFTWAADPNFVHDTLQVPDGPMLHFLYKKSLKRKYKKRWKDLQIPASEIMQYYSKNVGKYPYDQYSVIQGGDGGMEYGMCTLITGERTFESLLGVTAHEIGHTWFQFLMASNESKHPWLDEGFAEYTCTLIENSILGVETSEPMKRHFNRYFELALSGKEQPMSTHADRFAYNKSYSISTYSKGALVLAQLRYIIGEENFGESLKKYYNDWAFKHPTPNDFMRCAEKTSGMELEWFLTDWTQTTNTIDYGVKDAVALEGQTIITLERIGLMPMPVEVQVLMKDGRKKEYYIPLQMMRGERPLRNNETLLEDWAWAYPEYLFTVDVNPAKIESITIDVNKETADINKENNQLKI
ncbi:M1 family metallopeptidase [Flavobacteriaceae bacterium]|nr:M1 family metallopeptidase [Flavobacteriaceae bacterium]MDB2492905.1 M1 family metallopeptidase [Flavobacteriaceae bacterium]